MNSITYAKQIAHHNTEFETFKTEILKGLTRERKYISSKFLYDKKGSQLFEKITELPEYYQTRTEATILSGNIEWLKDSFQKTTALIELGSGSSTKTRILLENIPGIQAYVPIDISPEMLSNTVDQLKKSFPNIQVTGVSADYTEAFSLPDLDADAEQKVVFFPGSTIGNFEPEEAIRFLQSIRALLGTGDRMILGVDRKKDIDTLEAAYNDQAGITAAFNKNVLTRIKRELETDLDIQAFSHYSFYNSTAGRIEMHLRSKKDQTISIEGESITFKKGETIHTENSYKYSEAEIETLSRKSSFTLMTTLSDADRQFSVCILEASD
ncbi:L-histidine N(alpha)-methyltransferase [Halobacillus amylolyticus]|uniref:L-histidine N(Alpha)-methyltransferase n=1 Tax=Halobacillus amylolyticus TaxID=2932259 RepID=A0ABY4HDI8_9BACI|nr:L-histidine N(alpha)-methyltransferase [Halobacillus amylolyticus]UOR12876.1 L-histidine N(alpha)-methyltransferase [Halobacillus amylolyticus]